MAKTPLTLATVDTTVKMNQYKAVGNSLREKGKLTLSQHFLEAAEIIKLQAERIKELNQ